MTDTQEHRTESPDLAAYRLRRERELSSLYATARSLTALGEVDAVLDSIVRQAHELVGTDFTYLSLVGPDGGLTLTASEGTISSTFSSASVPAGTGVGGRVIATGAPAWVSNYLETRDVPHDQGFDDLVLPEGMVALLGVPLLVGEEGGRRPLRGRPHRAAVRARRGGAPERVRRPRGRRPEQRPALRREPLRAQAAPSGVRDHRGAGRRDGAGPGGPRVPDPRGAQGRRRDRGRPGCSSSTSAAPSPCSTARVPSRPSATTTTRPPQPAQRPSPDAVEQARQSGRWATTTDSTGVWHTAAAIQAGDSHLGALLLTRSHEPSPLDIRTLERAAQIMGLLILKETAVAAAEERVNGELLTELLVSTSVGPSERARAQARGIDVATLDALLVAESPTRTSAEVSRRLHALSTEWGGLAGEHLGRATLLVGGTDLDELAESVHARLRRELGAPVRVVAERVTNGGWGRAFDLAGRCSGLMSSLGVTDQAATTDRYAMFAMLFDAERAQDLDRFLADTIGPLLEYDEKRSTQLVTTLTAYFHHGGNLTRAAGALHVHVNTLLKRLDRVEAVLGERWSAPDRALPLQVALRLHELRA